MNGNRVGDTTTNFCQMDVRGEIPFLLQIVLKFLITVRAGTISSRCDAQLSAPDAQLTQTLWGGESLLAAPEASLDQRRFVLAGRGAEVTPGDKIRLHVILRMKQKVKWSGTSCLLIFPVLTISYQGFCITVLISE